MSGKKQRAYNPVLGSHKALNGRSLAKTMPSYDPVPSPEEFAHTLCSCSHGWIVATWECIDESAYRALVIWTGESLRDAVREKIAMAVVWLQIKYVGTRTVYPRDVLV